MSKEKRLRIEEQKNKGTTKVKLISNAAKDNSDYFDYANILFDTINTGENFNIGIIGSFGSGKSSLLKTYKKINSEKPFLKRHRIVSVSLANFYSKHKNDEDEKLKQEKEKYLESIIIQQILYSAKRWKLPSSRIKRLGIRVRSVFLIVFAIISSLLFVFSQTINFGADSWWLKPSLFWAGVLCAVLAFVFTVLCFPLTSIVATFKGVQIKSEPNIESTLFDEYLDELIYFFYKTKTNVVIFEDIDRCSEDDAFSKLRTLNFTLNNSPYFKKRKIHFIYAVKEDLFISSETKSKFFDVLISLPPFVSKNNSSEHLATVLHKNGIDDFDRNFLDVISEYIVSYRQINNIVNDYMLFKRHKIKEEVAFNNYLAKRVFVILTFKSAFPFDYLQFVVGDGYLWGFMKNDPNAKNPSLRYDDIYGSKDTNKIEHNKINNFYNSFKEFINESSLALISYFVQERYESKDEKFFYDTLKSYPDNYSPLLNYPKAVEIVSNKEAIEYCESNAFLNISLLKAIIKSKDITLKNKYFSFFSNATQKQLDFIGVLLNNIQAEEDTVFLFFKEISNHYNGLIDYLYKYDFFKEHKYGRRLFKESINNKTKIEYQNVGSALVKVFNNTTYSDEIICNMDGESRKYVLSLGVLIPNIDMEQYYKNSKQYKESVGDIVCSGKIAQTLNNYWAFCVVVGGQQKIDSNLPLIAQFLSLKEDAPFIAVAKRNFINYVNSDYKCADAIYGNDYSGCDKDILNLIFRTFNNDQLIKDVISSMPILEIQNSASFNQNILYKLAKSGKLRAPITIWNNLINNNVNLFSSFFEFVFDNCIDYLSDEANKDPTYLPLIYKLINDEKCDYGMTGKILELTCNTRTLSFNSITNLGALKCAIDYEYCAFNKLDIKEIPLDYLVDYFAKYQNDIKEMNDASIQLDSARTKLLLEKLNDDKLKLIVINKYIIDVDENRTFIENYVKLINDNFDNINKTLIKSLLESSLIDSKYILFLLVKNCNRIDNSADLINYYFDNNYRFTIDTEMITNEKIMSFKAFVKTKTNFGFYLQSSHGILFLRKNVLKNPR